MEAHTARAATAAEDVRFQDWEFEATFRVTFLIGPDVMPGDLVDALRRADAEHPWRYIDPDGSEQSVSVVIGEVSDQSLRSAVSISLSHPNIRLTPGRHSAYSAYLQNLFLAIQAMNIPGVEWINWELDLKSDSRGIAGQAG